MTILLKITNDRIANKSRPRYVMSNRISDLQVRQKGFKSMNRTTIHRSVLLVMESSVEPYPENFSFILKSMFLTFSYSSTLSHDILATKSINMRFISQISLLIFPTSKEQVLRKMKHLEFQFQLVF